MSGTDVLQCQHETTVCLGVPKDDYSDCLHDNDLPISQTLEPPPKWFFHVAREAVCAVCGGYRSHNPVCYLDERLRKYLGCLQGAKKVA